VTWAHDFALEPPADKLAQIEARYFLTATREERRSIEALRAASSEMFLAVQSLAPRKGLPLLLEAWRRLVSMRPEGSDILVLKLSFRHSISQRGVDDEIQRLLRRYANQPDQPLRIAFVSQILDDEALLAMTSAADALVSCSYGEGFGAPIVEALAVGTPVIAGRHTGIADLLPEGYPFIIDHAQQRVPLVGNPDVYPIGSTWCIPRAGAVDRAFERFLSSSEAERRAATRMAASHASEFCGAKAADAQLTDALSSLVG
jgi:glycosyltransferase involved in cell wall biosynthesis